jgi:hypothetical protein
MKHNRIATFALLFVLFAIVACAQNNNVVGTALDSVSNNALNSWSPALGILGFILAAGGGMMAGHSMKAKLAEGTIGSILMMNADKIVHGFRF